MMNNINKLRTAFSMIELIFVMVVLGIVASISSSAIVEILKSSIPQKASATASEKTELAAMQIANRLSNAVPWSLTTTLDDTTTKIPLSELTVQGHDIMVPLEWIGIDYDGFSATSSWSGYCDPNAPTTTQTSIVTTGSKLETTNKIIKNLSNNQVGLSGATQQPVIIFKTSSSDFNNTIDPDTTPNIYSPKCMGMINTANKSCAITAKLTNATTISMSNQPKLISEHYVLAWSAYAIVLNKASCKDKNNDGIDECDLVLYSNYQPWHGDTFINGKKAVLLNNVTVFKFTQADNTIKFKLCVQQRTGVGDAITTCKEKVVIR